MVIDIIERIYPDVLKVNIMSSFRIFAIMDNIIKLSIESIRNFVKLFLYRNLDILFLNKYINTNIIGTKYTNAINVEDNAPIM